MQRERREEIIAEWREALRPLLDEKRITQEQIAERLAGYYGGNIDQTNVSRWLDQTTPQPGVMSAILRMLSEVRSGEWPGEASEAPPRPRNDMSPARIFDLLEAEQKLGQERNEVARILAQAELERSIAARLAAEGARDLGWGVSPDALERAIVEESTRVARETLRPKASQSGGKQQPLPSDQAAGEREGGSPGREKN